VRIVVKIVVGIMRILRENNENMVEIMERIMVVENSGRIMEY
jgi:hypothetical protein